MVRDEAAAFPDIVIEVRHAVRAEVRMHRTGSFNNAPEPPYSGRDLGRRVRRVPARARRLQIDAAPCFDIGQKVVRMKVQIRPLKTPACQSTPGRSR